MFPALILGSLAFYVFIAAFVLAEIIFVACEKAYASFITLLVAVGLFVWLGDPAIKQWFTDPWHVASLLGGYAAVGVLWGVMKWTLFVWARLDKLKAVRQRWIADEGRLPTTEKEKMAYKLAVKDVFGYEAPKPDPAKHKGRIIYWMSYWPFSAIWTLINDPIRRFYDFLYRRITNTLNGISDRMFAGQDDFS